MPSRRRVLAGGTLGLAGVVGGVRSLERPVPLDTGGNSAFDWPMARYDPVGTGYNPDASGPRDDVEIVWQQDTETPMYGQTPPILVGETLYAIGRQSLVAFDRDTGEIRFTRDGQYWSTPARAAARAYRSDTLVVSGRAGLLGLSAGGGYEVGGRSIGAERWHSHGRETRRWSSSTPREPSPVTVDETAYAVVPDTDRVVAVDASSGRVRWERTIGDPRSIGTNRPAVRDGTVYVSSRPGDVVAVDAETGETRWSVRPEPHADSALQYRNFHPPTVTDAGLVIPDQNGVVLLDPSDGSVRWEYVHGGNATDGSAAVADGTVFVTDGAGSLHAIDLESGEREWTADYGPDTDPVVADGVVYLGYQVSELVAIDAETGDRRWTYEGATYFTQPIVGDGTLYVLTDEGLLALEEAT
ncbi:Outer membrane protein assembly factor BamB, contains PQQ-like beta-propeller repeat [Halobiforma haloterrestris]|uniref:Outer membrane protein assembly factor BamB, contains PQQ-like beta-propeller repeat n=1 Tax=Natronobacterium haloterrestre TaxID=148448 RepID=A0A1I1E9Z9_NATHA|nr:PQQ-binding-like beta-propeller repeat protein [Halobiforma haloterrestris]SFB83897.1 Outer membrane protein assembly factor BamB, contains PQQ-like beta-propeller repeat [Halobiforma haloterrestris]